jgi:hypothetical protein
MYLPPTNSLVPNPKNLPNQMHHKYNTKTAKVRKSIAVNLQHTSILEIEGLYSNAIGILKEKNGKEERDDPVLKILINESMNS